MSPPPTSPSALPLPPPMAPRQLASVMESESCIPAAADSRTQVPTLELGKAELLYNNLGGVGPEMHVPSGMLQPPQMIRYAGAIMGRTAAGTSSRFSSYVVRSHNTSKPTHYRSCLTWVNLVLCVWQFNCSSFTQEILNTFDLRGSCTLGQEYVHIDKLRFLRAAHANLQADEVVSTFLDLVITNVSEYVPSDSALNRKVGDLSQINTFSSTAQGEGLRLQFSFKQSCCVAQHCAYYISTVGGCDEQPDHPRASSGLRICRKASTDNEDLGAHLLFFSSQKHSPLFVLLRRSTSVCKFVSV